MDIEASARKHGVSDDDMLHAVRNHWRGFATDDPAVTMYIGPARSGEPLEVGVVVDEQDAAVIHAMPARPKFPHGVVKAMSPSRADRAKALEAWADSVDPADLEVADTRLLRHIAELAQQRDQVDEELVESVRAARAANRSWSEIGAMLGVSKQAAQRKYGSKAPA